MVKGAKDRVFDWFVIVILGLIGICVILPLISVVSMSITPLTEVIRNGGFVFLPKGFTLDAYKALFQEERIPRAFLVTLFVTVVGTTINMVLSVLMAYPLSKKHLPGRKIFTLFIVFTMLFNGGMIPTYIAVKQVGLINSVWSMILPSAMATFNVLLIKSFFENMPDEIFESAEIDGAGEFRVLLIIVLPLSLPVLVTVGLFYMVGNWNQFWSAILYINDTTKQPLQMVVRAMIMQTQSTLENVDVKLPSETLKMAAVIFASAPIIAVYPFLQKYFIKGLMLGAVKG